LPFSKSAKARDADYEETLLPENVQIISRCGSAFLTYGAISRQEPQRAVNPLVSVVSAYFKSLL
jgi:hypothetical protein